MMTDPIRQIVNILHADIDEGNRIGWKRCATCQRLRVPDREGREKCFVCLKAEAAKIVGLD